MPRRYATGDELATMLADSPTATFDKDTAWAVLNGLIELGVPVAMLAMIDVPEEG